MKPGLRFLSNCDPKKCNLVVLRYVVNWVSNSKTPVSGKKKRDTKITRIGQSEARLCKFQISHFLQT